MLTAKPKEIESNKIESNEAEPNGLSENWSRFEWSSNISLEIDVLNPNIWVRTSVRKYKSQLESAYKFKKKYEKKRAWSNTMLRVLKLDFFQSYSTTDGDKQVLSIKV